MKYHSAKTAKEVVLEGITVEFETRDGSLHSVTLTDKQGNTCKIAKTDYSTMAALVPAPPEKVKKFQVSGTLKGVSTVCETFDSDFEATTRKSEIERAFGYDEGVKLEVSPVEVELP